METVMITIHMPFSLKGTSLSRTKARFSSDVNCTSRLDSSRSPSCLATSSYSRMSFATRAARKRFSYLTDGRWLSTKDRTSLCNSSSVRWTNPVNFCQRSIQVFKSSFGNRIPRGFSMIALPLGRLPRVVAEYWLSLRAEAPVFRPDEAITDAQIVNYTD